ncbi:MAG TPA: MFS transporter [Chloroflexi bacterium]|nr:MFS transporter [Chloroflexota bacterium]
MRLNGRQTFGVIWGGQLVSQIGTGMTRFALLIWAYDQTGSAATVAFLGFFAFLPSLLVSPFAGVWVDRLDRRRVMLAADTGAGLTTLALLLLHVAGALEIWHLYAALAVAGACEAFQSPAYTAATTMLLPKEQYARAAGLRSLAESGVLFIAPFAGGLLLLWVGIGGVMLVDLATFAAALTTLACVRIPRPQPDAAAGSTNFRRELADGFRYTWQRPGLVGLMLVFMAMNFAGALTYFSTMPAMILARSGGDEFALAAVQATSGMAGLVGALAVSVWGGPRRKIHGVLAGAGFSFLCGDLLMALGRSAPVWIAGSLIGFVFIPFISSGSMAILQSKVAPALQGRVFALFAMVRQSLIPPGYVLAGVLADGWLEPGMQPGGALAATFGWLVGEGPGAGIALMFVGTSLAGAAICFGGYLFPSLRNVEEHLPDYDDAPPPVAVAQAA